MTMTKMDVVKITIGATTAILVVAGSAMVYFQVGKGFAELKHTVEQTRESGERRDDQIEKLEKTVKVKTKAPKFVVVIPTVIAVIPTPPPTPEPRKRGGLLGDW